MSGLLEDVIELAGRIGPRGTGTSAEAAAADYVGRRLTEMSLIFEKHVFRSVPSQNVFPIAISLMSLFGAIVYPINWVVTRWLAVLFSLGAGLSLWQTIRNAVLNPLRILLPKVTSQNIEARIHPKGKRLRKVILLAHLDTNRCRLIWQSLVVSSLVPMTWLTLAVPICMSVLYFIGAMTGEMFWWWLSLPLAAYELGALVTLLRDDRTPFSPGAHDNAASVAVALEVATHIVASPLNNTEVWLVFDGAEETDHAGIIDFLRRHGTELRKAYFIGLEGLGSGELVYLTRQGVCAFYQPTPDLVEVAELVAIKHPDFDFLPATMVAEDDIRSLRERGYHAICIAGRDPNTGILPRWHRPDDTPEFVSRVTMQRAANIIYALLEELDTLGEGQ